MAFDDSYMGWHSDTLFNWFSDPDHPGFGEQEYTHTYVDSKTNAGTLQTYVNWRFRVTDALTLNTGVHFLQFYLNNNYSTRATSWDCSGRSIPDISLSAGFGIHSRKESMTLYTGRTDTF